MLFDRFSVVFVVLHLCIFGSIYKSADGAHILSVFPHAYRSHLVLGETIIGQLLARGHKVTIISQLSSTIRHQNLTSIHVKGAAEHLHGLGLDNIDFKYRKDQYVNEELINTVYVTTALMNYTLGYHSVQELINGPSIFDILLIDAHFSDAMLGLAYHWNIPVVALSAASANKWTNEMVGNPHKSASNPSIYSEHTDQMTIMQRLYNALDTLFEDITYKFMYLPSQEILFHRYFEPYQLKRQSLPALIDLIHNVSMVLVNSHPAIHYPRPYVPNMIQIGGVHIPKNTKNTLPDKINEHMDEAPEGIILMSLGNTKSTSLPLEAIETFQKVFANLAGRMRIIWKWENATLTEDTTRNIIIGPWLPQKSILGMPKTRIFITNGGTFSILEAAYFGVPIIGLPLFGDQHFNVGLLESRGAGLKLDINNLNETILNDTIHEILNNDNYKRNAMEVSRLFQDNVIHPLDNAIYHIEMVLRNGGAKHLRSASLDLTMWQQHSIDVWLIIAMILAVILAVPGVFICMLLRKNYASKEIHPKENSQKTKKKKKE